MHKCCSRFVRWYSTCFMNGAFNKRVSPTINEVLANEQTFPWLLTLYFLAFIAKSFIQRTILPYQCKLNCSAFWEVKIYFVIQVESEQFYLCGYKNYLAKFIITVLCQQIRDLKLKHMLDYNNTMTLSSSTVTY